MGRAYALSRVRGVALLALASVTPLIGAGCFNDELCDIAICASEGAGGSGGVPSTGGEGGAGGSGGTGGEGAGLPDELCNPAALAAGQSVLEECGVFVLPGATEGTGTQSSPFGSLGEALARAPSGGRVYVCATGQPLDEAVVLDKPVRLHGGVTCADWTRAETSSGWTAPADELPLVVTPDATGATIQAFRIESRDAVDVDAGTGQGSSSIAAWIDGAEVTLRDVDIVAGIGAAGRDAEDVMGKAIGREDDPMLFNGNGAMGCGVAANGASPKVFECPDGASTEGARGGSGAPNFGIGGGTGLTDWMDGEPNGSGGNGDANMLGWACFPDNGHGQQGHDGPIGAFGSAGSTAALLTASRGYVGDPGGDGEVGKPGQGGGGGGGRRGNTQNGCALNDAGPGGGGGGAGGCGGEPGQGGGAGGASIALVVQNADIVLVGVTLSASRGGNGGRGATGQEGGLGGFGGGGGGLNACFGGGGGEGGDGGPGGGGAAGASIGVAHVGADPAISDDVIIVPADGAVGGLGGDENASDNAGANGVVAKRRALSLD